MLTSLRVISLKMEAVYYGPDPNAFIGTIVNIFAIDHDKKLGSLSLWVWQECQATVEINGKSALFKRKTNPLSYLKIAVCPKQVFQVKVWACFKQDYFKNFEGKKKKRKIKNL